MRASRAPRTSSTRSCSTEHAHALLKKAPSGAFSFFWGWLAGAGAARTGVGRFLHLCQGDAGRLFLPLSCSRLASMRPPLPQDSEVSPVSGGGQVVHWHADAPAQPAWGEPCNGCGLCCLAQPCPLGMLVSRRRQGACVALRWEAGQQRYLCGMVADPGEVTGLRSPLLQRWLRAVAQRWIAAGAGCDAHPLEVEPATGSIHPR